MSNFGVTKFSLSILIDSFILMKCAEISDVCISCGNHVKSHYVLVVMWNRSVLQFACYDHNES